MESETDIELLKLAESGDTDAVSELLNRHRTRLVKMVHLRMDRRLKGRIDASDVVQDATIEAARRLPDYVDSKPMDFYIWLRWITGEKLIDAHRHHLGVQKRNAANEVSIFNRPLPAVTSAALADQLVGRMTSPTQAAQRAEVQLAVEQALNQLEPIDREVLVLRHFEHLTNEETANVLELKKSTASKRYVQALKRFRQVVNHTVLAPDEDRDE